MSWEGVLGIIGTVCAIVFGYLAFARNKKADNCAEARMDGQVMSELGYVKSGIDDIKTEMRDQRQTNMQIAERLSAVESSAKQAHHRIDHMEGRIDHYCTGGEKT